MNEEIGERTAKKKYLCLMRYVETGVQKHTFARFHTAGRLVAKSILNQEFLITVFEIERLNNNFDYGIRKIYSETIDGRFKDDYFESYVKGVVDRGNLVPKLKIKWIKM